jgi:hypothetical protein
LESLATPDLRAPLAPQVKPALQVMREPPVKRVLPVLRAQPGPLAQLAKQD